jgi:hypothetical protein
MKRLLGLFVAVAFVASASLALAKDYQVTGPVVDVTNDQITVKKGTENWEIARDKDTKATGEIKKGDRVTIKYKMIATSVESKSTAKPADKTKTDATAKPTDKKAADTKTK